MKRKRLRLALKRDQWTGTIRFKGIAQDHRFYCLRRVLAGAWKVLAPCQFENLEKVNFEKFKVK